MKLLLFTDLHLGRGRSRAQDDVLRAGLAHAMAAHADADHIVMLGDLADKGAVEDYEVLREALADLSVPFTLLMGNHDNRAAFCQVFGHASGPVQQAFQVGGVPCYALDTLDPGKVGGSLSGGRLEWLDAELARAVTPGFVFLHHPPRCLHLPAFDREGLKERDRLAQVLAQRRERVLGVFFGHCHMPISATIAGVPALGLPALAHQSRPVFTELRYATDDHAAPGYGVLMTDALGFVLHRVALG